MILFHADDYGMTRAQAKRIISCHDKGVLNSVSIFVNGSEALECAAMLPEGINCRLHIKYLKQNPVFP